MTEKDMEQLRIFSDEIKAEEKRFKDAAFWHKTRIKILEEERSKIHKKCDHVWPSGKSAWVGAFMFSSCEICGLTDL